MILPDSGTVAYNGYQFDGASHVTISVEPVYDEAERSVIYHRYTIHVQSVVADIDTTDYTMAQIRGLITKPGKTLVINAKGAGDIVIGPSGINDVDYGPKPRVIAWEPIGSLRACEIIWECETCVAYCSSPINTRGILALNYALDYSIDYRGMTIRTTSGYLEIAAQRNGTAITDTADKYRDAIYPPIPDRFRRSSQDWQLSADKRRLDFSIRDEEIYSYNAYPVGTVNIDATHTANWSRRGGGAARLRNRITMDIELAPDQSRLTAIAIFLAIAKQRIMVAQAKSQYGAMIEDLTIEEGIFNGKASFAVTYVIYSSLKDILADTGIWTPVNSDWTTWKTSVQGVHGRYGYAGLMHNHSQEAIVEVCYGDNPDWEKTYANPLPDAVPVARVGLRNYTPHPYYSWLGYECHIVIIRGHTIVRHAVLQSPEASEAEWDPHETKLSWPTPGGIDDLFQKSGRSRFGARIYGWARRAGFPIPRPKLTSVGSAIAEEKHGYFRCWIAGNWLGVPIYQAKWSIDYELSRSPSEVRPPKNVKEKVEADGAADPPIEV